MNKTLPNILILLTLALLTTCGTRRTTPTADPLTTDPGVTINGITWATRNVDAPGTFAANPEDAGMLFQWGRKKGWDIINIDKEVEEEWGYSRATSTAWYPENDPCPEGWRVPTEAELISLAEADSKWTIQNDVNGRLFGTALSQLFLPGVTWQDDGVGGLYWSNTQHNERWAVRLGFYSEGVNVNETFREYGFSVRCVKIK